MAAAAIRMGVLSGERIAAAAFITSFIYALLSRMDAGAARRSVSGTAKGVAFVQAICYRI